MHDNLPITKTFYRPIEAAIRWAGLLPHKREIVATFTTTGLLPQKPGCPQWEELRLCKDRIDDAIVNRELPYGKNGVTVNDEALLSSDALTVRHVDLKRWMCTYYPEQRPEFLFSSAESVIHPFITLEVGQAILIERRAMKAMLKQYRSQLQDLQLQYENLSKKFPAWSGNHDYVVSDRAESTYLNIIGGMLILMLGSSPAGKPYSSFRTQEAIVSALVAHHQGTMGMTERTLNGKFASAKRKLNSTQL